MAPNLSDAKASVEDAVIMYSKLFGYWTQIDVVAKHMNKTHEDVANMEWIVYAFMLEMHSWNQHITWLNTRD